MFNMSLLVVCLLATCLSLAEASYPRPATGRTKEEVLRSNELIQEAFNAKNLTAYAAQLTDDCIYMGPKAPAISKEEGIEKLEKFLAKGAVKLKLSVKEVYAAGELAVTYGDHILYTKNGKAVVGNVVGKYVIMSKKVGGAYKAHYVIWNSNLPAPGSSAWDWL